MMAELLVGFGLRFLNIGRRFLVLVLHDARVDVHGRGLDLDLHSQHAADPLLEVGQ